MWWNRLQKSADILLTLSSSIDPTAKINPTAVISGPVSIGPGTIIGHGAIIEGPVQIGANCLVGDYTKMRGPTLMGDGSRVGYMCELRNAVLGTGVMVGPQCFVSDSLVEDEAFLGAQVRTSNMRLDFKPVSSMHEGKMTNTGLDKLGAYIGARAALGIQVVILPGRIVAPDSMFGPHVLIDKNYPAGRYMLKQELDFTPLP